MFIGECKFESLLLEIKQSILDDSGIEESIGDLNQRPFSSLFKNKGDRFLVKIYNEKFVELTKYFELDHKKFNIEGGYYDDSDDGGNPKTRYGSLLKIRDGISSHSRTKLKQLRHLLQQRNVFSYALFSRHPMDVIRMGDVGGITSCHSPDGSQFRCAQIESKNSGGIVFEIAAKDVSWVQDNLDKKDIFEDPHRDINGINPLARVRLRRLIDIEKNEDYAIPEERYYSPKGSSYGSLGEFSNRVLEYCKNNQTLPDVKDKEYYINNFILVGGKYYDTPMGSLINHLLGTDYYYLNDAEMSDDVQSSLAYKLKNLEGDIKSYLKGLDLPHFNLFLIKVLRNVQNLNTLSDKDIKVATAILDELVYRTRRNADIADAGGYLLAQQMYRKAKNKLSEEQLNSIYYIIADQYSKNVFNIDPRHILKTGIPYREIFRRHGHKIVDNGNWGDDYNSVINVLELLHEEGFSGVVYKLENILYDILEREVELGAFSSISVLSYKLSEIHYWQKRDRYIRFIDFVLDFYSTRIRNNDKGLESTEMYNHRIRDISAASLDNLIQGSKGSLTIPKIIEYIPKEYKELIDYLDENF